MAGSSIDRPLLFSVFINDLILFMCTRILSNYIDDNNLHSIGNDRDEVKQVLLKYFYIVIDWFYENYMVLNRGKCHYICIRTDVHEN